MSFFEMSPGGTRVAIGPCRPYKGWYWTTEPVCCWYPVRRHWEVPARSRIWLVISREPVRGALRVRTAWNISYPIRVAYERLGIQRLGILQPQELQESQPHVWWWVEIAA